MALTSNINFPSEMPEASAGGYNAEPYADLAVFSPDAGPDIVRRRTGRVGMVHNVSFVLDLQQRQIFMNFFESIISQGVLPFNWTEPYTRTQRTVRIEAGSLELSAYGPLGTRVSMKLQEISRA